MRQSEHRTEEAVNGRSVVTLGKFDGLHRGHQKLIRRVCELARGKGEAVVFAFDFPQERKMLLTAQEREERLRSWGVDRFIACPFTEELRQMTPEAFVREVLQERLHMAGVVVGSDFRFGKDRAGSADSLQRMGEESGFFVEILQKERDGDRDISSTYVREELTAGHMEKVGELLGYAYAICGEIVHGRHMGTALGFPTINLLPPAGKILPPNGVYAARVFAAGGEYRGISNLGTKPTVGGDELGLETHLYDCDRDLYGQQARVELLHFLRSERNFASTEELLAQIERDVAAGRALFAGAQPGQPAGPACAS